jgi:hypothetical protein
MIWFRKLMLLEYTHYRLMEALGNHDYGRARVLIKRKERIKNI